MCIMQTIARLKLDIFEMSEDCILVIKVTAWKISTVLPISPYQILDSQEVNYMVLEVKGQWKSCVS